MKALLYALANPAPLTALDGRVGDPVTRSVALPGAIAWLMLAVAFSRPAPVGAVRQTSEDATHGARTARTLTATTIPSSDARLTIRRLEGDLTGDCQVDIADIQHVASHYPSVVGDAAYSAWDDIDLDGAITINDLQFVLARDGSNCASPYPAQPPAIAASVPVGSGVSLALDPVVSNVWVCDSGQGVCGATIPTQVDAQGWQHGIVMNQIMTVNSAATMVLAYSFALQYDAAVFQAPQVSDLGVLNDGGLRTTTCSQTSPGAGSIVFQCMSAGPPAVGAMWSGPRTIAHVTLTPQPGIVPDFSAAGNVRVSDIVNDTASVTVATSSAPVGGVAEAPDPVALAPAQRPDAAWRTDVVAPVAALTVASAIVLGAAIRRRRRGRA